MQLREEIEKLRTEVTGNRADIDTLKAENMKLMKQIQEMKDVQKRRKSLPKIFTQRQIRAMPDPSKTGKFLILHMS